MDFYSFIVISLDNMYSDLNQQFLAYREQLLFMREFDSLDCLEMYRIINQMEYLKNKVSPFLLDLAKIYGDRIDGSGKN